MKKEFSKKWKASKLPRKQRKYLANAPLHIRHKMLSSNLSKDLRKKYGKRNFPLKKGDSIRIMRGEFKSKTGKIESVDMKKLRVTIEGIYRTKKDGTKVGVYFNPSNLQIKELNLEDKKRRKAIERKTGNVGEQIKEKSEKLKFKKLPTEKFKEGKNNVSEKK